ncbi:MAG TPA: glycosyltransferase family 2 protein [Kofleriaceae bacterium]|nr:glycosyltransferase family 2 protein [Kofleriaceae bacterium]
MYRQLRVAAVIPAFNEARAIGEAVASVPELVDDIIVVDDASTDATGARAAQAGQKRPVMVIRHPQNRGVGAAIITGYERAFSDPRVDVTCVLAGDGQMDPADLPGLLDPIADGRADYVKGNRFLHPDVWREMPPVRIAGNIALSLATKVTSGLWHVFDSQCGYTAISRRALAGIDLARVFPRYGYPNDLLARLSGAGVRVADVCVRPVYGPAWKSGIRPHMVIYPVAYVLLRSWLGRLGRFDRELKPVAAQE